MELRPYQQEARAAVEQDWSDGFHKTLLVLPTGCGKTMGVPTPAGGIAMTHQYTRQELEQLTTETPLWIEGVGLRQLQWGGWEVATHIHNGRLCFKHEPDSRGLLLSLYDQIWTAFDGAPERKKGS